MDTDYDLFNGEADGRHTRLVNADADAELLALLSVQFIQVDTCGHVLVPHKGRELGESPAGWFTQLGR
jgi:hypothetical protein